MRKDFGAKPYLYPQPVLMIASYDEDGTPDVMNAAWGGISDDHQISMCLSANHKTVKNILNTKAFTVSMATAPYTAECDYFGMVSGNNNPDKFAKSGLHASRASFVNAPIIEELAMALECTFISYDPDSCIMIGDIVNVCADEAVLDNDGNIDPQKLQPIVFDAVNHVYLMLGTKTGNAFKDGLKFK